jgi:hypothetical protein
MSTKGRDDRVAAEEVVRLYREVKILGYRVSRRRGIWLVAQPGLYIKSEVIASDAVLDHLKRNKIPRFKGPWEEQHTVKPAGLSDVKVLDRA